MNLIKFFLSGLLLYCPLTLTSGKDALGALQARSWQATVSEQKESAAQAAMVCRLWEQQQKELRAQPSTAGSTTPMPPMTLEQARSIIAMYSHMSTPTLQRAMLRTQVGLHDLRCTITEFEAFCKNLFPAERRPTCPRSTPSPAFDSPLTDACSSASFLSSRSRTTMMRRSADRSSLETARDRSSDSKTPMHDTDATSSAPSSHVSSSTHGHPRRAPDTTSPEELEVMKKDLLRPLGMKIHEVFPFKQALSIMRSFDESEQDGQDTDMLIYAAALGDMNMINQRLALQGSINVEVENELKITPLIAVCMRSNNPTERLSIVVKLLSLGGDPLHEDEYGNRAIDYAASVGLTAIVLVLQKANPAGFPPMLPKPLRIPPRECRERTSKKDSSDISDAELNRILNLI